MRESFPRMMSILKCLNIRFGLFLSFYLLTYVQCTPDFGLDKNSQGLSEGDAQELSVQSEADLKRPEVKREWPNFSTWGKRGWNSNFAPWGKRWNGFPTWGKRSGDDEDQLPTDKKSWFKLASWGKRSADDKRKWSQFSAWGKRGEPDADMDKRKWQQFSTWGKRNDGLEAIDKRKWSQFSAWGKRDRMDLQNFDADKRKWSQFAPWGKRNSDEYDAEKRKWSGLSTWGKRKWSGLSTWGKRAADIDESVLGDMTTTILQYFDTNGDGKLDDEEVTKYIITMLRRTLDPDVPREGPIVDS